MADKEFKRHSDLNALIKRAKETAEKDGEKKKNTGFADSFREIERKPKGMSGPEGR